MPPVLLRKDDIGGRDLPVDADGGIIPDDRSLGLRRIQVVALVLEHGLLTQHRESVREATRDEALPVVLRRQFDGDMPAEGRRPAADIDRDIQHPALDDPHKLALGMVPTLKAHSSGRRP